MYRYFVLNKNYGPDRHLMELSQVTPAENLAPCLLITVLFIGLTNEYLFSLHQFPVCQQWAPYYVSFEGQGQSLHFCLYSTQPKRAHNTAVILIRSFNINSVQMVCNLAQLMQYCMRSSCMLFSKDTSDVSVSTQNAERIAQDSVHSCSMCDISTHKAFSFFLFCKCNTTVLGE